MRMIIMGVGAVGGVVAANLALSGQSVVGVARGQHAQAMRETGLIYESPAGSQLIPLDVVTSAGEIEFTDDDVVLLGVKGQDTIGVLHQLREVAPAGLPIVCMQNGVDNERQALRLFPNVYGMCVMLPADHLRPGTVRVYTAPVSGLLDVGRYPAGRDALSEGIADALEAATFSSIARDDIMSWKYRKLLMNLGNAVEAVCGRSARRGRLADLALAEGEAVLAASGVSVVSEPEDAARRGDLLHMEPVDGQERQGGSSWQSLQRGTGTIETDQLTGEIVLLGRLHGVSTPVNERLQRLAFDMANGGVEPGAHSEADLLQALDAA